MNGKSYSDELERALDRSDADEMCRRIDAYAACFMNGGGNWPKEVADAFHEIAWSFVEDPDKALAYVVLGASRTDDAGFLGQLGAGLLEDLIRNPSDELLARVVAEARKSKRFRWLLSMPYKIAVSPKAWEAISHFRMTSPHDEPSADNLPPRM